VWGAGIGVGGGGDSRGGGFQCGDADGDASRVGMGASECGAACIGGEADDAGGGAGGGVGGLGAGEGVGVAGGACGAVQSGVSVFAECGDGSAVY